MNEKFLVIIAHTKAGIPWRQATNPINAISAKSAESYWRGKGYETLIVEAFSEAQLLMLGYSIGLL